MSATQVSSTNRFTHLLATKPWLLADGATGSNLFEVGLVSGDAPELWNSEQPEKINRSAWRAPGLAYLCTSDHPAFAGGAKQQFVTLQ